MSFSQSSQLSLNWEPESQELEADSSLSVLANISSSQEVTFIESPTLLKKRRNLELTSKPFDNLTKKQKLSLDAAFSSNRKGRVWQRVKPGEATIATGGSEIPETSTFNLSGNTTVFFRNPLHKSFSPRVGADSESGSGGAVTDTYMDGNIYSRSRLVDANLRTNANNDNFMSVADGIDLRARHIHALPPSNKAMPRKRENQRYFLGLGYLSRAFFRYLLKQKDARGDIIEFAKLQNVSRRRVYDIVCAMEGGGLIYAEKKHVVGWRPSDKSETIANAIKCFELRNAIKDMKEEEQFLDIGIQRMESLIRNTYHRRGKLHYITKSHLQRALLNAVVDLEKTHTGM